ncbi:chondroitinase family polysaccharide lyase [Echinicola shivajiensis]|uniref:chondroitinase family polysaccharide lyase n=1 Tax=Echinicola shivajiensis TaxID=1035916 RepID=UPI001BFCC69A|nr:chondroitinase family polysaccharide lyase [Echinicola shivajiensis]
MKINKVIIHFVSFFLFTSLSCLSQQNKKPFVESFEDKELLSHYHSSENSFLKISDQARRFGKQSLEWIWEKRDSYFQTSNLALLEPDPEKEDFIKLFPASPTFNLSVYSEEPQEGKVKISFFLGEKEAFWFSIPLNFYGWRTLRVPFYEMEGNVPSKTAAVDFDRMRMSSTAPNGKLFIDDIVFAEYQDDRHQYPDFMVPFIKKDQDHSLDHWMPLIHNWELLESMEIGDFSPLQKRDIEEVKERLDEEFKLKDLINNSIDWKGEFSKLKISQEEESVIGPPLTYNLNEVYYDSLQQGPQVHNTIREFGKVILSLAKAYQLEEDDLKKSIIEEKFNLSARYYLDQGWQKGSSGGTRHHIGYQTRELISAFYLMREPLLDAGLLVEIGNSIKWLTNLGMILADEDAFNVNIDYLNTQSFYHLAQIFLTEDRDEIGTLLTAFSNYMTVILAQEDNEWGFKADGTSWHHSGHYPAYGMGALSEVPKIFYCLAGTAFRIGEAGHANFRRALLTTAEYSHKYDWGFGNAGRHPFGPNNIRNLKRAFYRMALSGNPKGDQTIDHEVAGSFLYLWADEAVQEAKEFQKLGIKATKMPAYKSLPYAATAIHRNGDWAALIKGYNKYVWSSEIYPVSNRYGRYPANGSIELLMSGGQKESGYVEEGWDWNRFPGTTVLNMSFEELEPDMSLLMFLSEETFAGATYLDGNGLFGMILNSSSGKNADGLADDRTVTLPEGLMARKSVFSFGNKLICIGTGISSKDTGHSVQTNLFQAQIRSQHQNLVSHDQGPIMGLPINGKSKKWIIDNYGNAYYLLDDQEIHFVKEHQTSYHNKYSVKTGKMHSLGKGETVTEGDFASAWIDHGISPKGGNYQYVIYPFLTKEELAIFGKSKPKDFKVLQANEYAHIVKDDPSGISAYAIFEANNFEGDKLIKSVSSPSLIMVKDDDGNVLKFSVVNPDLNFPENPEKKNGFNNYSQEVPLSICLNGVWECTDVNALAVEQRVEENLTIISLKCVDGLPEIFTLKRQ